MATNNSNPKRPNSHGSSQTNSAAGAPPRRRSHDNGRSRQDVHRQEARGRGVRDDDAGFGARAGKSRDDRGRYEPRHNLALWDEYLDRDDDDAFAQDEYGSAEGSDD